MANAVELELDGSHPPKDQPNVFRECRRKCGWCCSIARRSHHVRLSVLAAFVALNVCIFAFSSYALRCQVSRALAGLNSNNAASNQPIQTWGANSWFQTPYDEGYFQGAHHAYSDVFAGGNVGAPMQHLANAGQPNVAHNTSSAGSQGYELGYFQGALEAYNIVVAMINDGVHVGVLMQHLANARPPSVTTGRVSAVSQIPPHGFQSIFALGEPLYGLVKSVPGVKSLLVANSAPTIPNPEVRSEPSSRNNCDRNDVDPKDEGKLSSAPHRGEVVDGRFRSDGAQEFLGTLYLSNGLQLFMTTTSHLFLSGTLVECQLFWKAREFDSGSGCMETVCAWKCFPLDPNPRRVQVGTSQFGFDEEVFAGGQALICLEGKCNTLPLRLKENGLVLVHPFFGLMRLPSRVLCSWCKVTQLFICASRAFKRHSEVESKEVPSKRVLVDIVEERGEFFAKPTNDSSIVKFGLEDQYGYVQELHRFGTYICVFEQCVCWKGRSGTGSVLVNRVVVKRVKRVSMNTLTTGWRVRVLPKDW